MSGTLAVSRPVPEGSEMTETQPILEHTKLSPRHGTDSNSYTESGFQGSSMIYDVHYDKLGKVIIINIADFYQDGEPVEVSTRKGSEKDVHNLKTTLEGLQIDLEVDLRSETTYHEILKYLGKCSKDNFSAYAMLICVVMSHGDNNEIETSEEGIPIKMKDIVKKFIDTLSLQNKPKIFMFQACRGDNENWTPFSDGKHNRKKTDINPETSNSGSFNDCLIIQSTIPGYESERNEETGTWFINTFCDVLKQNWESDEICTLLTKVNNAMRNKERKNEDPCKITKQMSTFTSMLRKKLYFSKKKISEIEQLSSVVSTKIPVQPTIGSSKDVNECSYNLQDLKPGKAIIINIDHFFDNNKALLDTLTIKQSESDVRRLKCVLETIGMTLNIIPQTYDAFLKETAPKDEDKLNYIMNCAEETTCDNIRDIIQKCNGEKYNEYAMFVFIFISYGIGNSLYASNNNSTINMDEIVHIIDESIQLQGKPKIFIFQRYKSTELKGYPSDTTLPVRKMDKKMTEPHLADCLVIMSSPPVYLSPTDGKNAPDFLQEFCTVLESYWMKEDMYAMLTRLNDNMCRKQEKEPQILTSSFKSMLTKTLYFSEEAFKHNAVGEIDDQLSDLKLDQDQHFN